MSINKNKWELVWADDFSGTEIDKSKWCYDIGNGYMDNHERGWVAGWGNDELQFYTDGSKNSFIRNGNLVLRAVKETYKGDVNHTIKKFNYTSTRIKTSGLFSKKYGRFEFRVKFPIGKGIWPAIWLMPQNNVYGAWAASGEIDIAEAKGSNPYSVAGTITYGNVWPSMKLSKEIYNFPDDGKISDYHVYVFEWEPGELRWYVDGNLYFTENLWHTIGIGKADYYTYPAPFDQEFYILLNIAVGGHFDGNPDDTTVFPQEMMVDYVKVYEKKGKYRIAGERPQLKVEKLTDNIKPKNKDGNYIYNSDFSQNNPMVNGVKDVPNTDYWIFVHLPDFEGDANLSIEKIGEENFAMIDIEKIGHQRHSIQLIQIVPLVIGRYYKVSFKAKSADNRTLEIYIGGDEDNEWVRYSRSEFFNLTINLQEYEFCFKMEETTDPTARLEINLGLNDKTVWIGKLRLEEIESEKEDPNGLKEVLSTGEYIYNGTFDQGDSSRMKYWNFNISKEVVASAFVKEETRQLNVIIKKDGTNAGDIQLNQKGLYIEQNCEYHIKFKAKALNNGKVAVSVRNNNSTTSYSGIQIIDLSKQLEEKSINFIMKESTDSEAQIIFDFGGYGNQKVCMDNVSLRNGM